jgi:spore germination protein KC
MIIILVSVLLLNGCGFKDIDKRLFVTAIGVDLAKNNSKKYIISLKFSIPLKDKPSDFTIVSEEGNSIAEAVRIIKTKVEKEIDFSQAKVIVFSEDYAKQNMAPNILYWFSRRRDIQEIAWVAVGKPTALEVLKVRPKSENLPSNAVYLSLGKEGSETPYVISEFMFDMKKRFKERGLDPYLPIIQAKKELFEINTVCLFNKKQVKLTLIPEETKMLNFLLKQEEKSSLKVKLGKQGFFIDTQKVKVNYKILAPMDKKPYIKVNVKVKGRIEEANYTVDNNHLTKYEKATERKLNSSIKSLLVKIQKANVDPIGFGLRFRSRHFNNDDWEEWKRIYPTITFQVQTKVKIDDTGLIE